MEIKSGKAKEIWGRKFRIVKNGLDEREVFSFIGSLIDQNREYAKKLEHLDSLVRIAENMIIEADKQAEGIKIEAEEKAGEKAKAIIIQAEEQTKAETERIITEAERSSQERISAAEQLGRDIVKAAEEKAEAEAEDIIAKEEEKAKAEAEKIIAEVEATTQERVSTAEQQAQYILKTAEEKAEEIKAPAKEEATKIVTEARQGAEELARVIIGKAEEQGQSILSEADDKARGTKEQAEREALITKQEAEQLLIGSKKVAQSEIREKLARVYREMLSTLDLEGIEQRTATSMEQEIATREPYEPGAAASIEVHAIIEEAGEQHPTAEEQVEEVSPDLYEGMVVLTIPPPIDSQQILQLHRHLRSIPQVQSLDLRVSKDRGITFRFVLEGPTPLLQVLRELPEIDKIQDAGRIVLARRSGDTGPVRQLIVAIRQ